MRVETAAERLLFATLRIEAPPQIGTGAIVEHRWDTDQRGPFLVTNKHVIGDSTQGTLTFTAGRLSTTRSRAQIWVSNAPSQSRVMLGGTGPGIHLTKSMSLHRHWPRP